MSPSSADIAFCLFHASLVTRVSELSLGNRQLSAFSKFASLLDESWSHLVPQGLGCRYGGSSSHWRPRSQISPATLSPNLSRSGSTSVRYSSGSIILHSTDNFIGFHSGSKARCHYVFATYSDPFKKYFVLLLKSIFSSSLMEMRSLGTVLAKNCQKVVPLFN